MEDMQERVLTLMNHAEDGSKARVTINPTMVVATIASEEDDNFEGVIVRRTNILLMEGQLEVFITMADLAILERAVGTYFLP